LALGQRKNTAAVAVAYRRAVERTRSSLFPIAYPTWAVLGVIALLDGIGQGSIGFGYTLRSDARQFVGAWLPYFTADVDVAQLLLEQTGLILVVGLPGLLFVYLSSILLLWIGSHGQLMFVRAVAINRYNLKENWRATTEAAQSLFMFRLALASIAFVTLVVFVLISALFVRGEAIQTWDGGGAFTIVITLAGIGAVGAAIINSILRNLVAPIMYQLNLTCLDAVKVVWGITLRQPVTIGAFFLVHMIWMVLSWGLWIFSGCLTCGIGLIPGIHHALCGPFYVFDRLLSMYLLESFWPGEKFVAEGGKAA
jgi:hypothetical protein